MSSPRRLLLGLVTFALACGWLAAQPPRKEEEEDPKEKARPVVPVPITEPDKKDAPKGPEAGDPDVGSFKEEMARAEHAEARNLFKFLLIPYDRLEANFQGGAVFRVQLLPFRELPDGEFEVQVLQGGLTESSPKTFKTGSGYKFIPFELIVLEQVDNFLNKKLETLDRADQLDYAARAVAAGLRWHLLAVANNKRVGKAWDEVEKDLRRRHIKLKREQFKILLDAKEYNKADAVGIKLLTRYPDNFDVQKDVYRLQLFRTNLAKDPTDLDLIKLRESLLLYERLPGDKDVNLLTIVRNKLRSRATALVSESADDHKKGRHAAALAKLRSAELLDPDLPGIAQARIQLGGKVLYVAVPKLPELMSPATAATDPERWAVELMFEGLLQAVPDPEVIRYRPVLAEALPAVMPLGRSFTLPKNVRWARDDQQDPLDARDVRGTLNLLRKPGFREQWCSDGLEVFHEIDRIDDPYRLRLAYNQGVLEPLARATFKVLPVAYLLGKNADDKDFARRPFGSGPFRYEGREAEGANRQVAVFRANQYYGQRPGKFGLPWIREIRMFVPDQSSLVKDVAAGQLHLYPDAPGDVAVRFKGDAGLKENLSVHSAQTNRRIHILAVNHRQTALQNDRLRQGLSAAINREAILKELFRAGNENAHAALTGPFPPKSWATPPTGKRAALYKPGAGGLIAAELGGRPIHLRLAYDRDEPKNAQVCGLIKKQIEEATADMAGKPLVTIDLVPFPAETYREKLYAEHDYDLALAAFDYRDDLYSLASLLDPEATGRNGRNFLGYMASGTNPSDADRRLRRIIEDVRAHRDFNKQVKEKTWDIHGQFNLRVPFVPLWQLDRYMVVHRDLELYLDHPESPVLANQLDPAVVFTGVEMWRLR
jgi:peptide/nickel transport system substrate-binding protein